MRLAASLIALVLSVAPALAHPHVWVSARSEIVHGEGGLVTAIRQAWTFDEMFAAMATQGLDKDGDGTYSREELQPLAQVNVESLREFGYFTFVKVGGSDADLSEPVDYWLDFTDGQLTLHFTLPVKDPQAIGTRPLVVEIYDPTYFVAFDMAEGEPVRLADAPGGCVLNVHRASEPDAEMSEKLQIDDFAMAQPDIGAQFANRILVNCP